MERATTVIYTLSQHDALPILGVARDVRQPLGDREVRGGLDRVGQVAARVDVRLDRQGRTRGERLDGGAEAAVGEDRGDRKSTRLNPSHANISYAHFFLKKKKK